MNIAIIGYGIVGATTAFYLSSHHQFKIDIYDDDSISGTKAAVGIVCPWVSQRRNKTWQSLVNQGAGFYSQLSTDLQDDSFRFNKQAIVLHHTLHHKLLDLANTRYRSNPIMGKPEEIYNTYGFEKGILIPGAFYVDGRILLEKLKSQTPNVNHIKQRVILNDSHTIYGKYYDQIIICCGGGLQDIINFDQFHMDFYPQKGMLLEFDYPINNKPMVIPQGEIDIIYHQEKLIIGASHQNKFNTLDFEETVAQNLITQAKSLIDITNPSGYRIGLRAQNSKNMPYYGRLNDYPHIIVASGLGSSGLTCGPLIGKKIADAISKSTPFNNGESDVNKFIIKLEQ